MSWTRSPALHGGEYLAELRDWPVGIVSEVVIFVRESAEEVGHGLATGRVVEFPVETLRFLRVPTLHPHFKRAVVRADRILFVERDVAHDIALENAVIFREAKAERILRRVVDVHSVKRVELGNKRVLGIHAEGTLLSIAPGPSKPMRGKPPV